MSFSILTQLICFFLPWLMFFIEPVSGFNLYEITPELIYSRGQFVYLAFAISCIFLFKKKGPFILGILASIPITLIIGAAIYTGFFATTGLFLYGLWITLACYVVQMFGSMYFALYLRQ